MDTQLDSTNSLDIATERLMKSAVLDDIAGEDPAPQVEETEELVEEEVEEVAEDIDDSDDIEDSDSEEEVEEQTASEEEIEQASYESLDDFAEALDTPLEELLTTIKAKVKVDGESSEITLDSLIRDHQKSRHFLNKANQLAEDRRQFDAQVQERMQQFESSNAQSAFILNTLTEGINKQINSPAMQQLRQSNVAEWNAKRIAFDDQLKALEKLRSTAAAKYDATKQKLAEDRIARTAEQLQQEAQKLEEVIPNWNSDVRQEITKFLMEDPDYQFDAQIVENISDHRYVRMAYEAMQYRKQLADADKTVKAVKKAPKLLRPNKRPTPKAGEAKKVKAMRGRLKKSGDLKDAAALIERIL